MRQPLSVLLLLGVTGCAASASVTPHGSSLSGATGSAGTSGPSGFVLAPLSLPEVGEKPAVESTVGVRFAAARQYLGRTIEQYVPRRVHEERGRDLGNGTKLDLTVTRAEPVYGLSGSELQVQVPLDLSISVRQRLGPIELSLGSCSPRVMAQANVSTRLHPDLTPDQPRLKLWLTQPCQLAMLDVSTLITQELERQQVRAEAEAQKHSKTVALVLTAQIAGFEKVLDDKDPTCPRLSVKRIIQGPVRESGQVLASYLAVQGPFTQDCGHVRTEAALVTSSDDPPRFELAEHVNVSWDALRQALEPVLRQSGLAAEPPRLVSAVTPRGERIALGLKGPAGTGWVFLVPEVHDQVLRLSARESESDALRTRAATALAGFGLPVEVTRTLAHAAALQRKSEQLSFIQLERPTNVPAHHLSVQADVERTGLRVVVRAAAENLWP